MSWGRGGVLVRSIYCFNTITAFFSEISQQRYKMYEHVVIITPIYTEPNPIIHHMVLDYGTKCEENHPAIMEKWKNMLGQTEEGTDRWIDQACSYIPDLNDSRIIS